MGSKDLHVVLTSLTTNQEASADIQKKCIENLDNEELELLQTKIVTCLHSRHATDQQIISALTACDAMLSSRWENSQEQFKEDVMEVAVQHICHDNLSVASIAGKIASKSGRLTGNESTFGRAVEGFLKRIQSVLLSRAARAGEEKPSLLGESASGPQHMEEPNTVADLVEKQPAPDDPVHEWRTSLDALVSAFIRTIECGKAKICPYMHLFLAESAFTGGILEHCDWIVREAGFNVILAVLNSLVLINEEGKDTSLAKQAVLLENVSHISNILAKGLIDVAHQPRMSASKATRSLLLNLPTNREKHTFYPHLLPQMCFNRHCCERVVEQYSRDTWRLVVNVHGKQLVENYIANMVEFYMDQASSSTNNNRLAATLCITELSVQVSGCTLRPFASQILNSLHSCMSDAYWPVRKNACLASVEFLRLFQTNNRQAWNKFFPLYLKTLGDRVQDVRLVAAMAMSLFVQACDGASSGGGKSTMRMLVEDIFHKTKQQADTVDPQHWQFIDGCMNLLGELSKIEDVRDVVAEMLPILAEAAQQKHSPHVEYLQTVCSRLPEIAENVGKRLFVPRLRLFLDPLFYSLQSCDNAQTSSAASQCLNSLNMTLGPQILKVAVEKHNPEYLEPLNANSSIAPF